MVEGFYRRPLPPSLVSFASDEGRALFREALAEGHLEGFFALAEQFHTQADPAFCGLASLVVVLNALGIDPGRLWRGPWRWYSEELLDCCVPLENVRQRGLSIDEVGCLARCNGASARVLRADEHDAGVLRAAVRDASRTARASMVVGAFDREALGQTGTGHFSPIGGYHAARDLALVLDVARFKYPPYWVSIARLHEASRVVDPATGRPRGAVVFTRNVTPSALLFSLSAREGASDLRAILFERVPARLQASDAAAAGQALRIFASTVAGLGDHVEERRALAPEHARAADEVRAALRATRAFAALAPLTLGDRGAEIVAALALAAPDSTWDSLPAGVRAELRVLLSEDRATPALSGEIAQLREQVDALSCGFYTTEQVRNPASGSRAGGRTSL
jgi:glutathione gamma-glutamylcysteinyltransferase